MQADIPVMLQILPTFVLILLIAFLGFVVFAVVKIFKLIKDVSVIKEDTSKIKSMLDKR